MRDFPNKVAAFLAKPMPDDLPELRAAEQECRRLIDQAQHAYGWTNDPTYERELQDEILPALNGWVGRYHERTHEGQAIIRPEPDRPSGAGQPPSEETADA